MDTVIEPVYPSSSLFLPRFVLFSFSFFSSTCLGSTGHSTRFNYAPQDRSPFVLALSRDTRTSGRDLLCVPASFRFVPLSASSDRSSCPYSTLLNVVELKCGGSSLRCQFFSPSNESRITKNRYQFVERSKIAPPLSLSLSSYSPLHNSVVKIDELITNSRLVSSPKRTKKKKKLSTHHLPPFLINCCYRRSHQFQNANN